MLRMNGDLIPIKFRELRDSELEGYITEILSPNQGDHFKRGNDLDFSYVSAEGGRFRVNVFRKDTGIGATFPPYLEVPTGFAEIVIVKLRYRRHDPGDRLDRHRKINHVAR
jgi:twitching motility protein PilT